MTITVYYDGKCGLYSREINYYRRISSNGIFSWQDITRSPESITQEGISLEYGLKLLHAKDANGVFHVGVDAFIIIWKHLKFWHLLARFIGLPLIYHCTDFLYKFFANWRFKRLKHCQIIIDK